MIIRPYSIDKEEIVDERFAHGSNLKNISNVMYINGVDHLYHDCVLVSEMLGRSPFKEDAGKLVFMKVCTYFTTVNSEGQKTIEEQSDFKYRFNKLSFVPLYSVLNTYKEMGQCEATFALEQLGVFEIYNYTKQKFSKIHYVGNTYSLENRVSKDFVRTKFQMIKDREVGLYDIPFPTIPHLASMRNGDSPSCHQQYVMRYKKPIKGSEFDKLPDFQVTVVDEDFEGEQREHEAYQRRIRALIGADIDDPTTGLDDIAFEIKMRSLARDLIIEMQGATVKGLLESYTILWNYDHHKAGIRNEDGGFKSYVSPFGKPVDEFDMYCGHNLLTKFKHNCGYRFTDIAMDMLNNNGVSTRIKYHDSPLTVTCEVSFIPSVYLKSNLLNPIPKVTVKMRKSEAFDAFVTEHYYKEQMLKTYNNSSATVW